MPTEPDPGPLPDLVLRPAVPEDAEEVATVHLAARRGAFPAMPAGVHPDHEVREWVRGRVAGAAEVWVAERDGAVVGYAAVAGDHLDDLYVDPDHAGQGVGSALLDLVKALRPDGFSLWVFVSNEPARAFYARHGLVELERTDGAGNEERSPDVRLGWPADPS